MAYEQVCRSCKAARTPPIEGPCPACGGFYRTIRRRVFDDQNDEAGALRDGPESAAALFARHGNDPDLRLVPTGMRGLDYLFGGGVPQAGILLLSAREGTGKTSFLWELFLTLAAQQLRCLYLSLEQGKKQLVQQFKRFGQDRIARAGKYLKIDACKDLGDVLDSIEHGKPKVVAVDSVHWVQGVCDDHDQPMKSGTAGAVERVARDVKELADDMGQLVFLVGHMNLDGSMAGGHALRHAVDATLGLHRMTDNLKDPRRVLRFETKTRFGEMGREALFKMESGGFTDCGPVRGEPEEDDEPRPTGGPPKLRLVN